VTETIKNHPNPQLAREGYIILDGEWDFELDNDMTGFSRGLVKGELNGKINVPFCPESVLSGVAHTDFIRACWYKKSFFITSEQLFKRVFINFGAVDYEAKIYINGCYAGGHRGGQTPFSIDISSLITEGENTVTVYVEDDINANVPSGKQSKREQSYGCFYSRITGIWQTVYLEFTPKAYIESIIFTADIDNSSITVTATVNSPGNLKAEVFYKEKLVGSANVEIAYRQSFTVSLSEKHLWEAGDGRLYDVVLTFGDDIVKSYFGLRSTVYEDGAFKLNGKIVFQRFVLDQGYYPKGLYTVPSKAEIEKDIDLAIELGFNGARLHQKVFDPYYLYYADKKGFMVWGEFPSWGVRYSDLDAIGAVMGEWREAVARDINHPSVITWCPLNETWEELDDVNKVRDVRFVEAMYDFTKTLDASRPCVDVSGGYHCNRTDLFDFHDYNGYAVLKARFGKLEKDGTLDFDHLYTSGEPFTYKNQALNLSEYGGASFSKTDKTSDGHSDKGDVWGYRAVSDESAFVDDYIKQTSLLLNCGKLSGFCYTQLYDIEQEQNGLLYYDRKPKFNKESILKIAACNKTQAKIETEKE